MNSWRKILQKIINSHKTFTVKKISIVIPAHNEEGNIVLIYDAVARVFASLNYTFEIIFVNDGSTDDTQNVLEKLSKLHPGIKTIEFSRNLVRQVYLII